MKKKEIFLSFALDKLFFLQPKIQWQFFNKGINLYQNIVLFDQQEETSKFLDPSNYNLLFFNILQDNIYVYFD